MGEIREKMSTKIKNVDFSLIISFIAAWALLILFIPQSMNNDNMIYAIGEINTYNSNLFAGNVYVGGGAKFFSKIYC